MGVEGLQLRSLMKASGELELSLAKVTTPDPGPDEVLVRVEATPINPSDLGLLLGPADLSTAKAGGTPQSPTVTAVVPQHLLKAFAARLDQSMPVGNEGAGTVIKAGANAKHLEGKLVAMLGGAMYAQYRLMKAADCLPLPAGATAADGASCFVNPLTALFHGRDHAHGGPQGTGPYRCRIEPRPDASEDLPEGRHRPRQYRP